MMMRPLCGVRDSGREEPRSAAGEKWERVWGDPVLFGGRSMIISRRTLGVYDWGERANTL